MQHSVDLLESLTCRRLSELDSLRLDNFSLEIVQTVAAHVDARTTEHTDVTAPAQRSSALTLDAIKSMLTKINREIADVQLRRNLPQEEEPRAEPEVTIADVTHPEEARAK